jgi:RNA polymerase sigma-70 factor (ECF subfamily)
MDDSATTRPSLLVRIRDAQDHQAWAQFVEIYGPLVYGFARRQGLQDADAADTTQEVLRAVAGAARKLVYDPRRGSFRGWLRTIVRNKVRTFFSSRKYYDQGTGGGAGQSRLEQQPDSDEDDWWEQEHQRRLFAWAAEQVRAAVQESTWQAFWQTAVDGKSGKDVADSLGMSVPAVYLAKGRVMTRLKELIQQIDEV